MPSGKSELRATERLLRATTPPATVTVNFRQRVVQASLDARMRQLSRRQTFRSACFGVLAVCILLLPVGLLASALTSSTQPYAVSSEFPAHQLFDIGFSQRDATSGDDARAIERQLDARQQNWLSLQPAKR